jgi:hypothetical protein
MSVKMLSRDPTAKHCRQSDKEVQNTGQLHDTFLELHKATAFPTMFAP